MDLTGVHVCSEHVSSHVPKLQGLDIEVVNHNEGTSVDKYAEEINRLSGFNNLIIPSPIKTVTLLFESQYLEERGDDLNVNCTESIEHV